MKPLVLRFVLPLSLIFFILFTKWWFVETELSVQYMYGFPMAYMALCITDCIQYFIMPLAVNLLCYFVATFLITWLVHHYHHLHIPKSIGYILWAINIMYYIPFIMPKNPEVRNEFYWQREFKVFRTQETGLLFIWEEDPVIDYTQYRPAKQKANLPK